MARNLHSDLNAAKNLLHSDKAWFVLFSIFVSDSEVFRLVNNETAVSFAGDTFSPFPIAFEVLEESGTGDLPYLNVSVSNHNRIISSYLEERGGLLDKSVKVQIVHESNLSSSTATIESDFRIRESSVSEQTVNFRLSHHPFFEVDLPHRRYYRQRCNFRFKGDRCGWVSGGIGSSEVCDKTLEGPNGCAAHLNTARFGGFPGIPKRRI